MGAVRLRHALRRDLDDLVAVWVAAFGADPFLRWIQPDDASWPAFGTAWLRFIADLAIERGHTYVVDPLDAAIAWIPPDLALVGPDDIGRGRDLIAHHAGETKADHALATIMGARGHAMEEPHWTLQYVGVRPGRQGSGLGALVVGAGLAEVDADGLRCGLVSTNPRNVPFYGRLGFEPVAEVSTPDGVATLRPMHRGAQEA